MIYNQTKYNNSWNTMKLKDLGSFARGKSKHRPRNDEKLFEGGGYPLIQTGEIKEANLFVTKHKLEYNEFGLAQSKLWDKGTLCITIAANIAETAILAYPMCFPDSIVGFNANDDVCSELFMHYIFTYIKQSIQNSASGSIQDNINIDYLEKLDFKIPNKPIQDKIVNVLYNIDKKVEININTITELENLSKMIYDYWFLQFDFPNGNRKPYKSSGGEMVWSEELKQQIPNGWEIRELKDIIIEKDKSSIQVNQAKNLKEKYPFFTSGNEIYSWKESITDGKNCYLSTGGSAFVKYYYGNSAYSTDTWCISAKDNLEDYLYLSILSLGEILNKKYFAGTGLKHLQKDLFKKRKFVIPPAKFLDSFNKITNNIFQTISKKYLENKELEQLRDFLLPLIMNGQVKPKNEQNN